MIKEYETLGTVVFKTNKASKRITVRYRDNKFHISYPTYLDLKEVEKTLIELTPKLIKLKAESPRQILFTPDTDFNTYSFNVKIIESGSKFYLVQKDNILSITCPRGSDFSDQKLQDKIRKAIEMLLRKEAKLIFPNWLQELSIKHNFSYNSLKINNSKSRWGSCSIKKNINLSFYCLLLPHHLIEFVMLHELCHTTEMNHGIGFWKLLDKISLGKTKELNSELKNYKTKF